MYRDDDDAFAQRQRRDYEDSVAYYKRAHRRRRLALALWVLAVVGPLVALMVASKLHDRWREQRWMRLTPAEQASMQGGRP